MQDPKGSEGCSNPPFSLRYGTDFLAFEMLPWKSEGRQFTYVTRQGCFW